MLPGWLKARVRLVHGDAMTEGVLAGYRSRTLSLALDDGKRFDIHALDVLAVELLDVGVARAQPGPSEAAPAEPTRALRACPDRLQRPPTNVF